MATVNPFQTAALDSNIAALPQIEQLTKMVNEINQRAQQTANAGRIPGGAGLEETSSANIQRALAGELDPSVINQLGQQAAERGAMTGSPLGPGSNAAYLKALGLNSLDLMNTGQDWLSQATARNPAAPIVNAGGMTLTPEQQAQIDLQQQSLAEQVRSNRARESLSRGSGGGVGGGSGGGSMRPASPAMNWADLFGSDSGNAFAAPTATTSSGWENDPFDWAWNGSTEFQPFQANTTPSWVMPQQSFSDGTPDIGNIMDGSLYGSIGYGATSGWEDDPFAWAWE